MLQQDGTHAVLACAAHGRVEFIGYVDLWEPDRAEALVRMLRNGLGFEVDVALVGQTQ